MIYKKIKYKGVSLATSDFSTNNIIITWFDHSVDYDTKKESVTTYHGERGYQTTTSGRTFSISGKIANTDPSVRQVSVDLLKSIIKAEGILSKDPNYLLEWEDFSDKKYFCRARVDKWLTFSHSTLSAFIDFSFSLWCETPQYYLDGINTITISPSPQSFWLFSGDIDGIHLWFIWESGNTGGGTNISNSGNFEAWVIISDTSWSDGWFYINSTNGLRYGVSGIANQRIINTTVRPTIVTDYWVDSSKNRMKWSSWLLLSPGNNTISANVSSYDWSNPPTENSITIQHYDTYI